MFFFNLISTCLLSTQVIPVTINPKHNTKEFTVTSDEDAKKKEEEKKRKRIGGSWGKERGRKEHLINSSLQQVNLVFSQITSKDRFPTAYNHEQI